MAKSDLRARPIFHHQRDSIEAHLTIVFAPLAISRHLQDATGATIKNLVRMLRPVRSATIEINSQRLTLDPDIPPEARELLTTLTSRSLSPAARLRSGEETGAVSTLGPSMDVPVDEPEVEPAARNVRFYGVHKLDPERHGREGFPDDKVRIVTENAKVIKFEQFGFEDG